MDRVGNSLFRYSLFQSKSLILMSNCDNSLPSLLKKEQPWANRSRFSLIWAIRSRRSLQKSNREQIALNFYEKERRHWLAIDSSKSL